MERLTVDRYTKWLLLTNLALFVGLRIAGAFGAGIDLLGFALPGARFWTPLTYMFTQGAVVELLFNMLWLWCFSRIFLIVGSPRQLLAAYIAGGLGGALFFAVAWLCGLIPGGILLGASAAVIGIAVAGAVLGPKTSVNLLLIGEVSLKTIALITVALSLLPFVEGNPGGGWAHIGGALAGIGSGVAFRKGWLPRFSLKKIKPRAEEMTLDDLLDKVRRSGYSSLTKAERTRLIELSNDL